MLRWCLLWILSMVAGGLLAVALSCFCALWMPIGQSSLVESGERVGGLRYDLDVKDIGRQAEYRTRRDATGFGVRYTQEWRERGTVGSCKVYLEGPFQSCEAGWPMPLFVSSNIAHTWFPPPSWGVRPVSAINAWSAPQARFVPLSIAASGLAANSLVFGAAILGFIGLTSAGRRMWRASRGLCRACGYPVPPTAICPECGRTA